jgi:protein-disulfide isomerase
VESSAAPRSTILGYLCLLVLAAIGVFVAGPRSAAHWMHLKLPCGAANGCDIVAQHPLSRVGNVPVAAIGLLAYLILVGLTCALLTAPSRLFAGLATGVSAVGALLSIVLTILSITVIHETCIWCLASAATMLLLLMGHGLLARPRVPAGTAALTVSRAIGLGVGVTALSLAAVYLQTRSMVGAASRVDLDQAALTAAISPDLVPETSPSLGRKDAPITVVVLTDLTCSACRAMHPEIVQFPERYPGIRVVLWPHPLPHRTGPENAKAAAAIAEMAAEKGQFWPFVASAYGKDRAPTSDELLAFAKRAGLTEKEVKSRLANEQDPALMRVKKDMIFADKMGITVTPTFLVVMPGQPTKAATSESLGTVLNSEPYRSRLLG